MYFNGITMSSKRRYSTSVTYNRIRSTMGCLSDFSSPKGDVTSRQSQLNLVIANWLPDELSQFLGTAFCPLWAASDASKLT